MRYGTVLGFQNNFFLNSFLRIQIYFPVFSSHRPQMQAVFPSLRFPDSKTPRTGLPVRGVVVYIIFGAVQRRFGFLPVGSGTLSIREMPMARAAATFKVLNPFSAQRALSPRIK